MLPDAQFHNQAVDCQCPVFLSPVRTAANYPGWMFRDNFWEQNATAAVVCRSGDACNISKFHERWDPASAVPVRSVLMIQRLRVMVFAAFCSWGCATGVRRSCAPANRVFKVLA